MILRHRQVVIVQESIHLLVQHTVQSFNRSNMIIHMEIFKQHNKLIRPFIRALISGTLSLVLLLMKKNLLIIQIQVIDARVHQWDKDLSQCNQELVVTGQIVEELKPHILIQGIAQHSVEVEIRFKKTCRFHRQHHYLCVLVLDRFQK